MEGIMMAIRETSRRCQFCSRDMTQDVSALSYAQNPFCRECFDERMKASPGAPENETSAMVGQYFYFFTPESQLPAERT